MDKSSPAIWNQIILCYSLPQKNDGLDSRMIQNLEEMVRNVCAHALELKYCDEFKHDCSTLLHALELTYKGSIHASPTQTPSILEKEWNPRLT
ncbi:hypothetical protein O181_012542 [Austropuccinia psidii MF-1]|uniref:Uncharacterized protein n=1 Tax=Austropuccinia psidii MF-1 TaxID=1389203 RepID=A0A9Q3GN43_9BASI|nr:hypothetical protein [Austropuccinia psidii MF-1]